MVSQKSSNGPDRRGRIALRAGAGLLAIVATTGVASPAEARETHTLRTDGAYARFYYKMDGQSYKVVAYLNDTNRGNGRDARIEFRMHYRVNVPKVGMMWMTGAVPVRRTARDASRRNLKIRLNPHDMASGLDGAVGKDLTDQVKFKAKVCELNPGWFKRDRCSSSWWSPVQPF